MVPRIKTCVLGFAMGETGADRAGLAFQPLILYESALADFQSLYPTSPQHDQHDNIQNRLPEPID